MDKATEKSQFDNPTLLLVEFSQFVQSVVESDHVHAAGLNAKLSSSVNGSPHPVWRHCGRARSRQESVALIGRRWLRSVHGSGTEPPLLLQSQVRFVHQGGALQGVAGRSFRR